MDTLHCKTEWNALKTRISEDRHFTICPHCAGEIDKRPADHVFVDGFYFHLHCPPRRNVYEEDL